MSSPRILRRTLLVVSVSIGLVYGLHHLLWLHDVGWDYQHAIFVTSLKPHDAGHYLAQLREIYEGNYRLSSAFIAEYKQTVRPFWPVLPFYLVAAVGKLLHLDVQYMAVLMDFTLPPLIFLLSYGLLTRLTGRPRIAMLSACGLVLYPHLAGIPILLKLGTAFLQTIFSGKLTDMLPALWDAHAYHNGFSRPINPQLTVSFLLASLLFFLRALQSGRKREVALTIVFGCLTSYAYIYFSTYLYLFWALFALISLLVRQRDYASKALFALGLTLLIALPFWWSVFGFSEHDVQQVTVMTKTHAPILSADVWLILGFIAIAGILLRQKMLRQLPGMFILVILLSAIGALNQRVITGREIQSWHYEIHILPQMTLIAVTILLAEVSSAWQFSWRTWSVPRFWVTVGLGSGCMLLSLLATPRWGAAHLSADGEFSPMAVTLFSGGRLLVGGIGIGFLLYTLVCLRRRANPGRFRIGRALYVCAFLSLFLGVTAVQYHLYYGYIRPRLGDMQQLAPALEWLNTHTEKESVVLCSVNYNTEHTIIPIYTHNNLYLAPLASCYPVPALPELYDRMYNILHLMQVTSREEFERYRTEEFKGASFAEYQRELKKDVYSELLTYRVDYVFYGPREKASFRADPGTIYPFLQPVYHDPVVTIYQVRKP